MLLLFPQHILNNIACATQQLILVRVEETSQDVFNVPLVSHQLKK